MKEKELWNYFLKESGHDIETLAQWIRDRTECLEALWRLCNTPGYPEINGKTHLVIKEQLQVLEPRLKPKEKTSGRYFR